MLTPEVEELLRFIDTSETGFYSMTSTLGLIAGNGRFPFLVLEAAQALGTPGSGDRHQGRNLPRD